MTPFFMQKKYSGLEGIFYWKGCKDPTDPEDDFALNVPGWEDGACLYRIRMKIKQNFLFRINESSGSQVDLFPIKISQTWFLEKFNRLYFEINLNFGIICIISKLIRLSLIQVNRTSTFFEQY